MFIFAFFAVKKVHLVGPVSFSLGGEDDEDISTTPPLESQDSSENEYKLPSVPPDVWVLLYFFHNCSPDKYIP